MLDWLSRKLLGGNAAETLYGEIVSAARMPTFYSDWGVPDTIEGRFEMVAMHMALMLERLSREGEAGRSLSRALTEACIADLDDNMREIGIGDLAVPAKVKKAAAALYDRHRDIVAALSDADGAALESVLQRDMAALPGAVNIKVQALARYASRQQKALADVSSERMLRGAAPFQRVGDV
jgi:cytochrome b pre-mRNA-processing protein 3